MFKAVFLLHLLDHLVILFLPGGDEFFHLYHAASLAVVHRRNLVAGGMGGAWRNKAHAPLTEGMLVTDLLGLGKLVVNIGVGG